MKSIKRFSFYGFIAVALFASITSCSKKSSSNSTSGPGTVSFSWNGQPATMKGSLDTGQNFIFTAVGVLPGTTDTSQFNIEIPNVESLSTYTLLGAYSDTASQDYDRLASFALIDIAASLAYEDYAQSPHPFTLNITSNNGNTINATFSGIVYREAGTGPDSLMVSNGHLTINY
jgi:hypothetical protein